MFSLTSFNSSQAQDAPTSVTAEQVEQSIQSACKFLLTGQNPTTGAWPQYLGGHGTGQTALVTLALLNAGYDPNHPKVRSAIEYLRNSTPTKTYETALQVMVFCAASPKRDLDRINRLARIIEIGQKKDNGWGYDLIDLEGRPYNSGSSDPSNAQFAALGLWEAQRVGAKVSRETLQRIARYWVERQANHGLNAPATGAWAYNNGPYSGSMTCAGIASMLMAEEASTYADVSIDGDEIVCCATNDNKVPIAELGLRWLARNFSVDRNPGDTGNWMYYLYGVERVGRLTGQRMIGNHDWYREGCASILFRKHLNGSFGSVDAADITTNTALGVLFLSKGKRQIVMARARLPEDNIPELEYQFSFKRHNHAMNNLNGNIELAWKRDLSWQSVGLADATVEALLESPVLFISGSEALDLSDKTKQALKDYVEQGGFIFAEARSGNGCDGSGFDESFRKLVAEIFEAPMRKLDSSHAVWNAQIPIDVSNLPPEFWLYGIESCCRTAVMYSPISLACRWELDRAYGPPLQASEKVRKELKEATAVGINVVTYATGRQLKDRLQIPKIELDQTQTVDVERGTLRLPRLRHAGGDDETPQAVSRLLSAMKESVPTQIDTNSPLLTPTSPDLQQIALLYISGREAFEYSSADREALRTYFANGGVLIGDAVCASTEFTNSLKAELGKILPEATWELVSATDNMLTNEFGGFDVRNVTILDPGTQGSTVGLTKREGPPVLERLIYKQRTVCIFSPYDISCALESRGATQCLGYERQDAARIGTNMIMYALME